MLQRKIKKHKGKNIAVYTNWEVITLLMWRNKYAGSTPAAAESRVQSSASDDSVSKE